MERINTVMLRELALLGRRPLMLRREYSFSHMADVVALDSGVFVASEEVFNHPESEETSTHFMAIDMGRKV